MEEALRHLVVMFGATTIPAALYVGIRWSNIRLRRLERTASDADASLAGRVAELEQQVLDLHERVDFAERLLAAQRDAGPLPGIPRAEERTAV